MKPSAHTPKRHAHTPHVALIIETTMAYGRRLLLGAAEYIRERGPWSVYFETRSLYDPAPAWLEGWDGDGIICRLVTPKSARIVQQSGIPFVNLNASIPTVLGPPWILNDQVAIGRLGGEHLVELGFTNYAYFGFPGFAWSDGRYQGFLSVVTELGLSCREYRSKEKRTYRYRTRSWKKEMKEVVQWVRELPKPIGILVSHDFRAVQLLDACRQAGAAVPEEVAVLGVDDEDIACQLAHPPLSSVVPNYQRIGQEAAALLDRLMLGGTPPDEPIFVQPLRIAARQSTDVTAIADPIVANGMHFIRKHACDGIDVGDLVSHMRLSRTTLQRRFQKHLGRSVYDVILEARMARVKQLLRETDLRLPAIASLAGFEHVEHMCTLFKQRVGQTTGEYRKTHNRESL